MLHADSYYRVTLPRSVVEMIDLLDNDTLNAVTKEAGGVSVSRNDGQWFDDYGVIHKDVNEVFQWNYQFASHEKVRSALLRLVFGVLWSTGEKSVMVEHMDGSGYCCKIVYPGTSARLIP